MGRALDRMHRTTLILVLMPPCRVIDFFAEHFINQIMEQGKFLGSSRLLVHRDFFWQELFLLAGQYNINFSVIWSFVVNDKPRGIFP